MKRLLYPTKEVGGKDKWLLQVVGPVYRNFSVHETRRVTHLVIIMFTEEVKDTVTLLLFYLVVIWECSIGYYLWEMYFSGSSSETTWLWFRAAGGSLRPSAEQGATGRRRPKGGAVRPGTLNKRRDAFKAYTLWMWESMN